MYMPPFKNFLYYSSNGLLGCFHFLATVNNAAKMVLFIRDQLVSETGSVLSFNALGGCFSSCMYMC